jgi:hypothetical protein
MIKRHARLRNQRARSMAFFVFDAEWSTVLETKSFDAGVPADGLTSFLDLLPFADHQASCAAFGWASISVDGWLFVYVVLSTVLT